MSATWLNGELLTTHEWIKSTRPWWWWLNPWLYIRRRDRAYADALDALVDEGWRRFSGGGAV